MLKINSEKMSEFSFEETEDLYASLNELMTFKGLANTFNLSFSNSTNNNDSTWTTNDYLRERIVIDVCLVPLLILFGFVGNALTIVVLCRQREKNSSTNWLLQTLAVVDTLYLIASIFIQPLKTANEAQRNVHLESFSPYMDAYVWALASIAHTVTVWTVVVVTVDRYVAVCRPYSPHLRTVRRARLAMVVVVVAAVVYNIPNFLERRISYEAEAGGEWVAVSTKTSLSFTLLYSVFYKTVCYFVMRSIGPLLLLVVLNSLLIRTLHRMERRRKDLVGKTSHLQQQQQRENTTLMLVAVVAVFIVCQIPDVMLRLTATQLLSIPGSPASLRFRLVNSMTNFMLTLNSSVNFLIYCLIGRKFRCTVVHLFCRCCGGSGGQLLMASENLERQPLESFLGKTQVNHHSSSAGAVIHRKLKEGDSNHPPLGTNCDIVFNAVCLSLGDGQAPSVPAI